MSDMTRICTNYRDWLTLTLDLYDKYQAQVQRVGMTADKVCVAEIRGKTVTVGRWSAVDQKGWIKVLF